MPYMTRVRLADTGRTSCRILSSPNRVHAALEASGASGDRILWRLDETSEGATLYIVSGAELDAHEVESRFGIEARAHASKPYDGFLDSLSVGSRYLYRLKANASHRCSKRVEGRRRGYEKGSIRPCFSDDEASLWLHDRAQQNGFVLDRSPQVVARSMNRFFHKGRTVTQVEAVFEGTLTVTDPDLLRRALVNGIGRAKAFGCGLMTVIPLT